MMALASSPSCFFPHANINNNSSPLFRLPWPPAVVSPRCCQDSPLVVLDKGFPKPLPGRPSPSPSPTPTPTPTPTPSVSRRWYASDGRVRHALALLEEMPESGEGVSEAFSSSWHSPLSARDIVAILNQETSWSRALAFFHWARSQAPRFEVNIFAYNVMLKILRHGLHWDIAKQLWNEMLSESSPVKPDCVSYSTVINFAARKGLLEEAHSIYNSMLARGIEDDFVLQNTMIDVYVRLGLADDACRIFNTLKSDGYSLGNITYSSMIKLYCNQLNHSAVLDVYREMRSKGITPNVSTFNMIIGTLSRVGKIQATVDIFHDMVKSKVNPNTITWTFLIRMYGRARMVKEAFEIVEVMSKLGAAPDTVVYNALLNTCTESGLVKEGEGIFLKMQESGENSQPDEWTYRTMVHLYASAGQMNQARKAYDTLTQSGYSANMSVYTALIYGYGKAKDWDSAQHYFDKFRSEGVEVDDRICGALLSILTLHQGQDSARILKCIVAVKPSLWKVIDILLREGNDLNENDLGEKLDALLADTQNDSHMPLCNMLIDLCWKWNLGSQAHSILKHGCSTGVYSNLLIKTDLAWYLNLHSLSFGAAQIALQGWLRDLSVSAETGKLPPTLIVDACLGRRRLPAEAAMNTFVASIIEEMKVPFEKSDKVEGQFVATKEAFQTWLQSREVEVEVELGWQARKSR